MLDRWLLVVSSGLLMGGACRAGMARPGSSPETPQSSAIVESWTRYHGDIGSAAVAVASIPSGWALLVQAQETGADTGTTARVLLTDAQGRPLKSWPLPKVKLGFRGGGLVVRPHGGLVVAAADRVMAYDAQGRVEFITKLTRATKLSTVALSHDGHIAVGGSVRRPGKPDLAQVARLTATGTVQWRRELREPPGGHIHTVSFGRNDSIMALGVARTSEMARPLVARFRVDGQVDRVNVVDLGHRTYVEAYDGFERTDGTVLVGATGNRYVGRGATTGGVTLVFAISPTGTVLDAHTHPGSDVGDPVALLIANRDEVWLAANDTRYAGPHGTGDVIVRRLAPTGRTIATWRPESGNQTRVRAAARTEEGLMLVGTANEQVWQVQLKMQP